MENKIIPPLWTPELEAEHIKLQIAAGREVVVYYDWDLDHNSRIKVQNALIDAGYKCGNVKHGVITWLKG